MKGIPLAAALVASVAGLAPSGETDCFPDCESPTPNPLIAVFAVFPEIACARIFSSSPRKGSKSATVRLTPRSANLPKYACPSLTPFIGSRQVIMLTSIWFNLSGVHNEGGSRGCRGDGLDDLSL